MTLILIHLLQDGDVPIKVELVLFHVLVHCTTERHTVIFAVLFQVKMNESRNIPDDCFMRPISSFLGQPLLHVPPERMWEIRTDR